MSGNVRLPYRATVVHPWYNQREREWAVYVNDVLLVDDHGAVRYFITAAAAAIAGSEHYDRISS